MSLKKLFIIIFIIIFLVPIFAFSVNTTYLLAFLLSSVCALSQIKDHNTNVNNTSFTPNLRIIIITSLSFALIYSISDTTALENRSQVREGILNYSFTFNSFLKTQMNLIFISISALLLSDFLFSRRTWTGALGAMLSSYLLISTGTRWYFLLSAAPVLAFFAARFSFPIKLTAAATFSAAMISIAIARSAGTLSGMRDALIWDIPSLQSYRTITLYDGNLRGLDDFFYGNFLVLIPRFLWPTKPDDAVSQNFMLDTIGNAYFNGATVLPGFLGSSWLYGGYLGVAIFSIGLFWLFGKAEKRVLEANNGSKLALASLLLVGLALQVRNISIQYLVPALYLLIIVKLLASYKKLMLEPR